MTTITNFHLDNPDATDAFGQQLAKALATPAVLDVLLKTGLHIALEGDLGAGKTTLSRALLRGLGVTGPVKSPTFSLLELYDVTVANHSVVAAHFDFYRFETPEEFEDAGFSEYFAPATLALTEWSEKALPYMPVPMVTLHLKHADLSRTISVEGEGTVAALLNDALVALLPDEAL